MIPLLALVNEMLTRYLMVLIDFYPKFGRYKCIKSHEFNLFPIGYYFMVFDAILMW
jgi:hypothetical protein